MFVNLFARLEPGRALLGFLLLSSAIVVFFPLLPFIDLPNHLAEATIYKSKGDNGTLLTTYFETVPWYYPNTFHAVFCSLFPSVEFGNRVFHVLYVIALHGSLFLVIRELKGNLWVGLAAIPFTFNYNVTYGFVGFVISLPVLVILFYLIVLDFRRDILATKLWIALALVGLYFMHAQNALFGLVLFAIMTLFLHRQRLSRALLRLILIPIPLLTLLGTWWFGRQPDNAGSTGEYLLNYYQTSYFESFLTRTRFVVLDNFQLYEGWPGVLVAAVFFLCVLLPVFLLKPWTRSHYAADDRMRLSLAFLFFMTAAACYLFLPDMLPGQTPLYQRFCTIVILSIIIVCSVWTAQADPLWLKAFVICVGVVYSTMWFEYFWTFNRDNKRFDHNFFAGIESRQTMAGLIYEPTYRGRRVYIHFPSYFIVWNHGLAATKIIDYRFGIVRRTSASGSIPFYHEYIGEHYSYQPQYRRVNLFLVRGEAPVTHDRHLSGCELLRMEGKWAVYGCHNSKRGAITRRNAADMASQTGGVVAWK